MRDLIDRQAAIDAINKALDRETLLNSFVRKVAIDAVKELPPAQPECEDAVSRQTLKDGFTEMCNLICPYSKKQQHVMCGSCLMGTAFDVLEATPPVTPKQPGWIPTSERLPDNDRAVLVTLKWAEDDYEVAVGEYWHNSTASHGWGSFEGHVIAWHELPTPYREGGQDGKN